MAALPLPVLLAVTAAVAAPHGAHAGHPAARGRLIDPQGVREARTFVAHRAGTVSFAVLDDGGHLHGFAGSRAFPSASVAKAMLLVAICRSARDRPLSGAERALLEPMITESDNDAAIAAYPLVGGAGMLEVARAAHMQAFVEVGHWSDEQITAADQVRFFWRLDRLLPDRHRRYARHLLESVIAPQRWGMPAVAEHRGLRILFKGGWRPGLTHQVARVERGHRRAAIAVLTSGGPSQPYGRRTIAGIAARVLRKP